MRTNDLSVLIGGEAGAGIARSGFLLAKTCMRGHLQVFGTNDYQSLIRGGHNFYIVRINDAEVNSQVDSVDLLIALNAETIVRHVNKVVSSGGVIFDKDDTTLNHDLLDGRLNLCPIPLKKIVDKELKGQRLVMNTVALGAAVALVDYDLTLLEGVLRDTFKAEVAESNIKAAQMGYEYLKENVEVDFEYRLRKRESDGDNRIFVSGNEAIGLGAVSAGCKFYAAYPMTPSTGVLHFMAMNQRQHRMIVLQPEGEIAAINMVIGAAFAGARAMTATSGGGFCLMSESLGMTGMTETPVVIMVAQRPGPSTGLPTYSSQGDLKFVMHASQGEFPRIIIAPGDVEECFYETARAFNWAEKYQLPVILLTDKYLVESQASVEAFDAHRVKIERGSFMTGEHQGEEEYMRHRITETGVSPRTIPSTQGVIVRTSANEHDERGYTTEDPMMTKRMRDKRMRKIKCLAKELEERNIKTAKLYGPEEANSTIFSWGSTKGPIRETIRRLNLEGSSINYLQILYLSPFPTALVEKAVNKTEKTIVVENNMTAQLGSLFLEHVKSEADHKILKYDGRPFSPGILYERIKEVL